MFTIEEAERMGSCFKAHLDASSDSDRIMLLDSEGQAVHQDATGGDLCMAYARCWVAYCNAAERTWRVCPCLRALGLLSRPNQEKPIPSTLPLGGLSPALPCKQRCCVRDSVFCGVPRAVRLALVAALVVVFLAVFSIIVDHQGRLSRDSDMGAGSTGLGVMPTGAGGHTPLPPTRPARSQPTALSSRSAASSSSSSSSSSLSSSAAAAPRPSSPSKAAPRAPPVSSSRSSSRPPQGHGRRLWPDERRATSESVSTAVALASSQGSAGRCGLASYERRAAAASAEQRLGSVGGKGSTGVLTYVFLAGVEGTGHHGFMSLLLPYEEPPPPDDEGVSGQAGAADGLAGAKLGEGGVGGGNANRQATSESSDGDGDGDGGRKLGSIFGMDAKDRRKAFAAAQASTSAFPQTLVAGLPAGYPEAEEQVLRMASTKGVHAAAHELWRNDDAGLQQALRQRLASELGGLAASVRKAGAPRWLVGPLTVDGQPLSYPFGEARNAVQRPVLAELRAACLEAGVRLKVVGLWRDPLEATYSRVRAMRNSLAAHALLQARIVDDNLRFVASDILSLPCNPDPGDGGGGATWAATVRYEEDLVARPAWSAAALAAFTGLDPAPLLQRARDAVHQPATSSGPGMAVVLTGAAAWGLRDYFGYQDDAASAPAALPPAPPPSANAEVVGPGKASGRGSGPAVSAPHPLHGGRSRGRRALLTLQESLQDAWAGLAKASAQSSASVGGTSSGFSSFGSPPAPPAPPRGGSKFAAFNAPPPLSNVTLQARGWWPLFAPELHLSRVIAAAEGPHDHSTGNAAASSAAAGLCCAADATTGDGRRLGQFLRSNH